MTAILLSLPAIATYALTPMGVLLAITTLVTRQLGPNALDTAKAAEAIGKLCVAVVPVVLMFLYAPKFRELATLPEADRPELDRSHPAIVWLGAAAVFLGAFVWVFWGLR